MENVTLLNKKIYDDYESSLIKREKNKLVKIYKWIILSFLFVSSLTILLMTPQAIFVKSILNNKSLSSFFDFGTDNSEQTNAVIIFRFFTLSFLLFYPLAKNYMNLYFQKETIKKYWPWFIGYLSFSIVAFGLFLGFYSEKPLNNILILTNLILLLGLNIGYSIYSYKLKRKTEPLTYSNKNLLIIGLTAQGLLVLSVVLFFGLWVYFGYHKQLSIITLFHYNKFYNFWKNLFGIKNAYNPIIILVFAIYLAAILVGANLEKITFLTSKNYNQNYFKNQIVFSLSLLTAILVWFIRIFFIKVSDANNLGSYAKTNYLYVLEVLFGFILLTIYILTSTIKRLRTKSTAINTIYFAFFETLLWISLLIINFLNRDAKVNVINIFFISLFSTFMLLWFIIKNRALNIYTMIFLILTIFITMLTLTIFGLNQILLGSGNYLFYTINSHLYLMQIILITQSINLFTFFITSIINLIIILFKISQTKVLLGKENYVK
ncbi:MSC_0624 family F1-like ATPase-associated membrane protein [Metamycoplasma buccale]|uniref:MSC_0624 family F1-like ATPase-associated membrane protein n=1 Tax=Metamycoplasma buccale TaxID=55602 RepID=UPI00398F2595